MDIAQIQTEARHLLDMELQREIWTLPTKKAERMEAYEARHDAIVDKLVAQARKHGGTAAQPAPQQAAGTVLLGAAASDAPHAAVVEAAVAAGKKSEAAPAAQPGDLVDDLDSPAF